MSKLSFDYAKWDRLEISDDEDAPVSVRVGPCCAAGRPCEHSCVLCVVNVIDQFSTIHVSDMDAYIYIYIYIIIYTCM